VDVAANYNRHGCRDRILILNLYNQKHINIIFVSVKKAFLEIFIAGMEKITSCEIDLSNEKLIDENLHKALKDAETLKGIFVTSSKVYKVAGFLERHNIRDILLVGYDLIDENIKFLEKGIISFLIGQKPEEQGYNSIMTMFYFLMQNRTANKVNYSPIDIILKENIDYYKNYKS
jgi:LacI family transcriptional regulator